MCYCRCFKAANAGDLQFLQSKAHPFDEVLHGQISFAAAAGGHMEVLRWLSLQVATLSRQTCTGAAAGGHLVVLQWAWEQGCHWDERTCAAAARY